MAQPGKMIDFIKGRAGEAASSAFKKVVGETANAKSSRIEVEDFEFEPGYPKWKGANIINGKYASGYKGPMGEIVFDSKGNGTSIGPASIQADGQYHPGLYAFLKYDKTGFLAKQMAVAHINHKNGVLDIQKDLIIPTYIAKVPKDTGEPYVDDRIVKPTVDTKPYLIGSNKEKYTGVVPDPFVNIRK